MSRAWRLNAALAGLTLLGLAISIFSGRSAAPLAQAMAALLSDDASALGLVMQEIRLPRAILGAMVGAALGLGGAILQGLLRNPLAEPGLIGISSTAALGAAAAFYTGLAALFPLALPLGGMAGAMAAAVLILALAGRNSSVLMLILAGIAVNAMAGALIALVLNLAPSPYAALEIFFWLLGSLADRSFSHVALAAPLIAIGWALMAGQGRALDALSIGEETAASLGVNVAALHTRLVAGIALSVGAAVAVSGVVGFVGLVVPHLLRPLVGHQPSHLLLPSALGGAALTLAADSAVRLWWSGPELRLGVVTALIGAPFFFALLLRTRRALT